MYCYCKYSVALPHGAVARSAVCDCGISKPYLLTFDREQFRGCLASLTKELAPLVYFDIKFIGINLNSYTVQLVTLYPKNTT